MPKTIDKNAMPKQAPRRRGPMGHGPMGGTGEKAKDFKGTFKKLLAYIGNYKFGILVVFLFAIASTVFNIVGPKILGKATTKIFEGIMATISNTGSVQVTVGSSSATTCSAGANARPGR